MSPTLFYQLLCGAVNTAILLVAIDMNNLYKLSTLSSLDGLVCIFVQTLFYCYLAERVTTDLLLIGHIFYESIWYCLPVAQQKLILLSIQRSQKEFRLKGLGLISCSLWVFASVSNNLNLSLNFLFRPRRDYRREFWLRRFQTTFLMSFLRRIFFY